MRFGIYIFLGFNLVVKVVPFAGANRLVSQFECVGFTENLALLVGEIGIQNYLLSHLLPIS